MKQQFINRIVQAMTDQCDVKPTDGTVIVGLSGGADSVALISALHSAGYDLIALHANFHLRGEESDRDEKSAVDLCCTLGIKYEVKHFDVNNYRRLNPGISIEMACRDLRYNWFKRCSAQYGDAPIAVAHHRDDNIETFFINLMRGTGLSGLRAMLPRAANIVRPMLGISRSEILNYIEAAGLNYVVDSTNLSNEYRRNKVRNEIMPIVIKHFPDASKSISSTIGNLSSTESLLNELAATVMRQYIHDDKIDLKALTVTFANASTLLYWHLREKGFNSSQCSDMIDSLSNDTPSGQIFTTSTHRASISRGVINITAIDSNNSTVLEQTFDATAIKSYPKLLEARVTNGNRITEPLCNSALLLDYDALISDGSMLTVRSWKQGDKLYPFGMKGSRLVSDIFQDNHIDEKAKHSTPILIHNDRILWVAGLRASRFYPITSATKRILKITIK